MSTETDDVAEELEKANPGVTVDEKGAIVPTEEDEGTGKVSRETSQPLIRDEEEDVEEHDEPGSDGYDEREALRAARREERAKRKQARRAAIQNKDRLVASLQMQVQDLSERLARVDNHQVGNDFAKLDEELSKAVRTAEDAKQFMKSTAEAGDWDGNADATELFYNARRQAEHLHGIKQRVTRQPQQPQQVDGRISKHASDWMSRNRWYKHGSDETDSIVTKTVDDNLVKEGYDPRTKEYWEELDDRLAEKLPHRFGGSKKMKTSQGAPNIGGSDKNSVASSGGKGFFLSEARIKAMKEAGSWDDQEARKKMIARYKDFDKNNPPKGRS
jgi:hypothetical protein